MWRWLVWLAWLPLAVAQQDPLDAAVQSYWTSRSAGQFAEAAAHRDQARHLLSKRPSASGQFAMQARNVAQLYDSSGKTAQGRAILEEAIARVDAADPGTVTLLSGLGDSWEQDRNLLKAVAFRERAVAALEQQPREAPRDGFMGVAISGSFRFGVAGGGGMAGPYEYQQLANTYRQLGRKQDFERVMEKLRSKAENPAILASLYEQQGQIDEAAAIYREQAQKAGGDAQETAMALQNLGRLSQIDQRPADAAALFTRAADLLASSGRPELQAQALWARQNAAFTLGQAGQAEAADQLFEKLIASTEQGTDGLRAQFVNSYAGYLANTKRVERAETLVNGFLASHPELQPWEEANLLYTLSAVANQGGRAEKGLELQRLAVEKQRTTQPGQAPQAFIGEDLQRAQSAASAGKIDEALELAARALDAAPRAADREQIAWSVPNLITTLGAGTPAAQELDRRLTTLLESWSVETVEPLLNFYQGKARNLLAEQRWREAAAAIDRYRSALVAARGETTGWLEDVLRLEIEAARTEGAMERGRAAAADLLALAERLSGTTSEPYLRAVETMAEAYELSGDSDRSVALRLQAVELVDRVAASSDARRGFVRTNAAFALARVQLFDQAEQLARAAVEMAANMRPAQPNLFEPQLEQIRQMKAAAASTDQSPFFRPTDN